MIHRRVKNRPKQAVRLGHHRGRHSLLEQAEAPATDHGWVYFGQEHPAERRRQVLGQRPSIQVDGARAQSWTLSNPRSGIRPERHLPSVGIRPLPTHDQRLLDGEPVNSLGLAGERVRRETPPVIGVEVTCRVPSRRHLANVAKSAWSFLSRHQAAHPARRGANGGTVQASMYSVIADSGMRT